MENKQLTLEALQLFLLLAMSTCFHYSESILFILNQAMEDKVITMKWEDYKYRYSCSIIIIVLAFESSTPCFYYQSFIQGMGILLTNLESIITIRILYINKEGRDEHGEEKVGQKNKQNSPHRF